MNFNREENVIFENSEIAEINDPLVVDLDGTFINTDLLHEGIILLFKKNPLYIFLCLFWLTKGKACFKKNIFARVNLRYDLLPCNPELLVFLHKEYCKGRKLILATASPQVCARKIGEIYPIFDEIYGTKKINLKGTNKLKVLIDEFGAFKFDYIGNSKPDLRIFTSSRYSYLVNPSKSLEKKTKSVSNLKHSWKSQKVGLKDYLKAIRAYQWIKNLLIFVPLITSHSFSSVSVILQATWAFFAFSFAASAGYIINDILDLDSDRAHPGKKFRPFASGKLSIPRGLSLAFILLVTGLFIAMQLNFFFSVILTTYFVISLSYSIYFKKILLYDVFILALLYSIRVFAGAVVISVSVSFWLIAFSIFIFLSLAFVKRYSELMKISNNRGLEDRGREYRMGDLGLLQIMGIVSGFLSVVVFSLYINSPEVYELYTYPKILWAISLLFLFWISRIWVITNRGNMTDDPIVFTIKDPHSYFIFSIVGLIIWISI